MFKNELTELYDLAEKAREEIRRIIFDESVPEGERIDRAKQTLESFKSQRAAIICRQGMIRSFPLHKNAEVSTCHS